jgi:hypothetical protein
VVPVGETRRVELGFRAPSDFATRPIRGPHAPFNALLYVGAHTGPAAALARMHFHVPVEVTAWGL